jgi:hypothetical protein
VLARGQQHYAGTGDACNFVSLTLAGGGDGPLPDWTPALELGHIGPRDRSRREGLQTDRRLQDRPADVKKPPDVQPSSLVTWGTALGSFACTSTLVGGGGSCGTTPMRMLWANGNQLTAACPAAWPTVWAACAAGLKGSIYSYAGGSPQQCDSGDVVVGGMCECPVGGTIVGSHFAAPDKWECTCTSGPPKVTAVCLHNSTNTISHSTIGCAGGAELIGGGCKCTAGSLVESRPDAARTAWVCICTADVFTAYSICAK